MAARGARGDGVNCIARRVAILGAESSGKSTLACALAERFSTVWVPEYLRRFVEREQRVPREEDQLGIARAQLVHEDQAAREADGFVFCDTTPLMTAIYSRFYFGRIDPALEALARAHRYAHTLVTMPDSPWVSDGLQRESDAVRQTIHVQVLSALAERSIAYVLVQGTLEQRLSQATDCLGCMGCL